MEPSRYCLIKCTHTTYQYASSGKTTIKRGFELKVVFSRVYALVMYIHTHICIYVSRIKGNY